MRGIGSSQADPVLVARRRGGRALRPAPRRRERSRAAACSQEIGSVEHVPAFIARVKRGEGRLMGFGHRVYKSYDPRARIIKRTADDVFEVTGRNPLLDIALELERIALVGRLLRRTQALPERGFLLGAHLPGDGLSGRHVPGALRDSADRGLARAVGRDAAGRRNRRSRGLGSSMSARAAATIRLPATDPVFAGPFHAARIASNAMTQAPAGTRDPGPRRWPLRNLSRPDGGDPMKRLAVLPASSRWLARGRFGAPRVGRRPGTSTSRSPTSLPSRAGHHPASTAPARGPISARSSRSARAGRLAGESRAPAPTSPGTVGCRPRRSAASPSPRTTPHGPVAMTNLVDSSAGTADRSHSAHGPLRHEAPSEPGLRRRERRRVERGVPHRVRARAARTRPHEFTYELVWFDGEEAFVDWMGLDHTYGSRYYVQAAATAQAIDRIARDDPCRT